MHVSSAAAAAERAPTQPVAYVVFDLLWLDGLDVMPVPYQDRVRLLGELVEPGPTWRVTESHFGGGADLLAVMKAQGMEGLIAKRRDERLRARPAVGGVAQAQGAPPSGARRRRLVAR